MHKYSYTIKGNDVFEYTGTIEANGGQSMIVPLMEVWSILEKLKSNTIEQLRIVAIEETD